MLIAHCHIQKICLRYRLWWILIASVCWHIQYARNIWRWNGELYSWNLNLQFLMSQHPELKNVLFYRNAYGIKAHLLNMTVYALGVFPLTYLIVNLKPTLVTARNVTSVDMVCTSLYKVQYAKPIHRKGWYVVMLYTPRKKNYDPTSFSIQQSYIITTCMLLVLAMNMYAVGKEILQMIQQVCIYCTFYFQTCLYVAKYVSKQANERMAAVCEEICLICRLINQTNNSLEPVWFLYICR